MEDVMWQQSIINITPVPSISYDDLYNVANAHGYLVKTGEAAPKSVRSLAGRLFLSHSGWIMLAVPNPIVRGLFDAMDEPGIELPLNSDGQLLGHISVIRPEELEQLGGAEKITERGHHFSYQLGPLKTVVPAHWSDVSRCWFVEVKSPELEKLRKTYGLTPKPNENKFQFHFTIAVRKKKVLHENEVSKAASDGNLTDPSSWGFASGPSLVPDATVPHSVRKTDTFSLQDEDNEPQEDLTRTDVTAQGPTLPYSGKEAGTKISLPVIGHYEQIGKITRQAFGYVSPTGKDGESFAQCGTCALWNSKANTCNLFGPGVHVPASASCNYYLHGSPKEALVEKEEKQILTPAEAGFVNRKVRCENCLLPENLVQGAFIAASKAMYSGEAVKITTRSGFNLSLTVKHPVFTETGLIAAGKLDEGDYIVCQSDKVKSLVTVGDYVKNTPTPIEQVFQTFTDKLITSNYCFSVKLSTLFDFHGDGHAVDGDIQIIRANRSLWRTGNAKATQSSNEFLFAAALNKQFCKSGGGSFNFSNLGISSSLSGRVSSDSLALFGFTRLVSPISFPNQTKFFADLGLSSGRSQFTCQTSRSVAATKNDTTFNKVSLKSMNTSIVGYGKHVERLACLIQLDQVVKIERFHYVGPVYDLQSNTGYMIASGIYISNCAFADADDPANPYCELYEKMNDAFPSVFDLDKKIESKACCSFNTERGKKVAHKEKAEKSKTIAIDLDGTICEYDGWKGADHFGKLRGGVITVLKKLQEAGHTIIVWTTRGNTEGVKAHLDKYGVPYDHINNNPNQPPDSSDKMIADAYVDDRAVSARSAWPEIHKELVEFLDSH